MGEVDLRGEEGNGTYPVVAFLRHEGWKWQKAAKSRLTQ